MQIVMKSRAERCLERWAVSLCSGSVTRRPPALLQFLYTYDNYMNHAFPKDELKPLSCTGEVGTRVLVHPLPRPLCRNLVRSAAVQQA